jgi:hypothetical protein
MRLHDTPRVTSAAKRTKKNAWAGRQRRHTEDVDAPAADNAVSQIKFEKV